VGLFYIGLQGRVEVYRTNDEVSLNLRKHSALTVYNFRMRFGMLYRLGPYSLSTITPDKFIKFINILLRKLRVGKLFATGVKGILQRLPEFCCYEWYHKI